MTFINQKFTLSPTHFAFFCLTFLSQEGKKSKCVLWFVSCTSKKWTEKSLYFSCPCKKSNKRTRKLSFAQKKVLSKKTACLTVSKHSKTPTLLLRATPSTFTIEAIGRLLNKHHDYRERDFYFSSHLIIVLKLLFYFCDISLDEAV